MRGSGSFVLFGGIRNAEFHTWGEIRDASRLIQESESSDDEFAMQFKEFQQLDVDVLVDDCSPGNQSSASNRRR